MKVVWALFLGFFIWRMIPVAKDRMKNGPKGSSSEWLNVSVLLAGVVLFVVFLMYMVRS